MPILAIGADFRCLTSSRRAAADALSDLSAEVMTMWWWDGSHWPMMFWPFGFMILCVVMMAVMMRHGGNSRRQDDDPLDILRKRFARGEIDQKEYEERKRLLSQR